MRASVSILVVLFCISLVITASSSQDSIVAKIAGTGVRHLRSISCEDPVTGFTFSPLGVAFGLRGELYVVDADNSRIFVVPDSLDGLTLFVECPEQNYDCQLIDVEADDTMALYVSERSSGRIMVFDENGEFISDLDAGAGVTGISGGSGGQLYAAMGIAGSIRVLDPHGEKAAIDCPISASDESYPVDCVVGGLDKVFVTESFTKKVLVLSLLGSPQGGLEGFDFASPFGLCRYRDRLILISDSEIGIVAMFTPSGRFVDTFGVGLLKMPTFLDSRDDGIVCVADPGKMTIEVFRIEQAVTE